MSEKLQQCLKMFKYLDRTNSVELNLAKNSNKIPLAEKDIRHFMNFEFKSDGLVDYRGCPSWQERENGLQEINIKNLEPTDGLIDLVITKLTSSCLNKAKRDIEKRLIEHQLKCEDLGFLIEDKSCKQNQLH